MLNSSFYIYTFFGSLYSSSEESDADPEHWEGFNDNDLHDIIGNMPYDQEKYTSAPPV